MDEIPGPAADIVIDAADVFAEQTETDKLRADENEEQSKKGEDALCGPGGPMDQPQHHEQDAE